MKTKYIAVPVSERLPEKEGCYPIIFKNSDIIRDYYRGKDVLSENFWKIHIEYWLEEKEDHSEEMLFVMKQMDDIINKLEWPYDLAEEISQLTSYYHELINKVKDNG